ncbi:uncharacterized protein LOC126263231 [Schistocerca nitens]|uniref:uncharacterized protein LOC126263231 n=1 Tax=Schistocerca nitens TaxID=7011 RepID=UPI0021192801|nr:uncharacterized protein LOC126263231 [Schistocerca nitens]
MNSETFDALLDNAKEKISRRDTVMRKSIAVEECLTATLRFLATGRSLEDLKFATGISAPSLSNIIPETCKAIYETLQPEVMKHRKRRSRKRGDAAEEEDGNVLQPLRTTEGQRQQREEEATPREQRRHPEERR